MRITNQISPLAKTELGLSVVIPNYNGSDLLRKNIPHVIDSCERYLAHLKTGQLTDLQPSTGYELIVIDDASSDDSVEMLQQHFPTVRVLEHTENQGYSEAVYSGIYAAKYEKILLLNSDVETKPQTLLTLIPHLDSDDVFSVSPTILDENDNPIQASWNIPVLKRGRIQTKKWSMAQFSSNKVQARSHFHLFGSGGSMALKRSAFLQLGGYLGIYKPFYFEDMDLGVRAWLHGWKVVFEPQSVVIHPQGGTINRSHKARKISVIKHRNRLILQWLYLPRSTLLFSHTPRLLLRYLEHLILLHVSEFHSLLLSMAKIPEITRARHKLKHSKTLEIREIIQLIQENNPE